MIHYPLCKADRIKLSVKNVKMSVDCLGQVKELYKVSMAIYILKGEYLNGVTLVRLM
jgi:hypothetical protein